MYSRYEQNSFEQLMRRIENLIENKFEELFERLENGITQDNLIDVKEACRILGVTRITIYNWINQHKIKYLKKGNKYLFNRLYISNLNHCMQSSDSNKSTAKVNVDIEISSPFQKY